MKIVYCFDFYPPGSAYAVHNARAATLERIEKMDGVPLRETGLEVQDDQIDANGFFLGKANCGNAAHS